MKVVLGRSPRGLLLLLLAPPTAECFIICAGVGSCVANNNNSLIRPRQGSLCGFQRTVPQHDLASHVHRAVREINTRVSCMGPSSGRRRERTLSDGLRSLPRMREATARLFSTLEEQGYDWDQREDLEDFLKEDGDEGEMHAFEEEKRYDEESLPFEEAAFGKDEQIETKGAAGPEANQGQVVDTEAQICFEEHDFWGDLAPVDEYDPTSVPDDAVYSGEELVAAGITCKENPFDFTSFYVDRDIKVGNIDEKKRKAIRPMMHVVDQVCELIDTTDDVFSFKYIGLIVHKRGIQAWTKLLIKQHYAEVKDVVLVTNRTRDRRDH